MSKQPPFDPKIQAVRIRRWYLGPGKHEYRVVLSNTAGIYASLTEDEALTLANQLVDHAENLERTGEKREQRAQRRNHYRQQERRTHTWSQPTPPEPDNRAGTSRQHPNQTSS